MRFKTRTAPDIAFGWNLIGAVAGGLLEFSSMAVGFRALSLIALAAYGIAFGIAAKKKKRLAAIGEPTVLV